MSYKKDLLEKIVYGTTRIECEYESGQTSKATGFFYNFLESENKAVPCIVSNRHAIKGAIAGTIYINHRKLVDGLDPALGCYEPFRFECFEDLWEKHPDPNIDLAVFPIHIIYKLAKQKGVLTYTSPQSEDSIINLQGLSFMEDIFMIGYPDGLWDEVNNLPIIRKGCTATHPAIRFKDEDIFLADLACHYGSSGSPVYLAEITKIIDKKIGPAATYPLLGILSSGHTQSISGLLSNNGEEVDDIIPSTDFPINLGYVIPAKRLLDFEKTIGYQSEKYSAAIKANGF